MLLDDLSLQTFQCINDVYYQCKLPCGAEFRSMMNQMPRELQTFLGLEFVLTTRHRQFKVLCH